MRKARGADLACLAALPSYLAEVRRSVHEADLDAIASVRQHARQRRLLADARPNWREQPARESLTGVQMAAMGLRKHGPGGRRFVVGVLCALRFSPARRSDGPSRLSSSSVFLLFRSGSRSR